MSIHVALSVALLGSSIKVKHRQDISSVRYQCPNSSSYVAHGQTGSWRTDLLDVTTSDVVEHRGLPVSVFFSVSEKPPGSLVDKSWEAESSVWHTKHHDYKGHRNQTHWSFVLR